MTKFSAIHFMAVVNTALAFGNCPSPNSVRFGHSVASFQSVTLPNKKNTNTKKNGISMFQEVIAPKIPSIDKKISDKTKVGTLMVPSVGIGTISWSSKSLTTLENLELQSLVKEAYDLDGAFYDTAERYGSHMKTALGLGWGETETLLQKFVKRSEIALAADRRENEKKTSKAIVATKFTPSPWRTTAQSVVEACEQSKERLGVKQIDLYQLHMPDIVKPFRFLGMGDPLDEVYWEGLAECYHRGLVKNVGVCNYGPTLVTKCQEFLAKRGVPLASNQIAYSLIGRENGSQDTVDACSDLGVKVLAYYPFAMGLLTGKYSQSSLARTESTLTSFTKTKKTSLELKDLNKYAASMSPLLSTMDEIAATRGKTVAQVALNYIVSKDVMPIPGAHSVGQVKDNAGAMGWRLTNREVTALEEEADKLDFYFEGAGFKRTSEKFVGYGVEKWSLD